MTYTRAVSSEQSCNAVKYQSNNRQLDSPMQSTHLQHRNVQLQKRGRKHENGTLDYSFRIAIDTLYLRCKALSGIMITHDSTNVDASLIMA